ncbi:hypothetical protein [Oleidesulfovibrio sp.]|uniref:hypothetical protein n=1 Tax=Oleidesulfovibrio sp. TaxID=2909707 RepID=UPI003A85AB13
MARQVNKPALRRGTKRAGKDFEKRSFGRKQDKEVRDISICLGTVLLLELVLASFVG